MNFEIVIPTYKREEKLRKCLASIPKQDNVNIQLCFDNNDIGTWEKFTKEYPNSICMQEKAQAFGIWNWYLQGVFAADIFVYLCDDTELYPDTLINIEKHFVEKFPDTDGVVTFNQVNIDGSDSAMGCIGRKFAARYTNKQCFCPDYVSFYADSELGDYAKKLNKFHFGEDCRINHYHPGFYKNADEAHRAIRGKDKQIDIKVNKIRRDKRLLWGESFTLIGRDYGN